MGKRRGSRWVIVLAIAVWFGMHSDLSASAPSPLGRKMADFQLRDYRGKAYDLDAFKDRKLLVVAVLGAECPLARLYGTRLAKLHDEFAPRGVGFVGIDANYQDSIVNIAAYAQAHNIPFPILKDIGQKVVDQLGAERTPEVFVLDQDRVVRYWGRIDDQYDVGASRDAPQREDLRQALTELLDGKPVTQAVTKAPGCFIGRLAKRRSETPVTYTKHIASILQKRCVECHRPGEIGPFALTKYSQAASWAKTIAEVVEEGRMPPWHALPEHGAFSNERRLTDEEKTLLLDWVAQGTPQGDAKDPPPMPSFRAGWQLPRAPDQVVYMQELPLEVPAEGAVRYQYFFVDPEFKEDKWIAALEVVPGNRAVVHHILVFAYAGNNRELAGLGVSGYLAAYVPGLRAQSFPAGMAKQIKAGSRLVFQIHYTPNGSKQEDRSKIGFVFADPNTIKQEVKTLSAAQRSFQIPPQASQHKVEGWSRDLGGLGGLGDDVKLLGLMPHMHLRGKAIVYEAVYPNGEKETLLDVPRFDFNWQTSYRLATPKPLPRGTRIHAIAHFDNSTNNPHNPDPTKTVRWGEQTWDEMMIGYFDIALPVAAGEKETPAKKIEKGAREERKPDAN